MWKTKFRKGKMQSILAAMLLAVCALMISSSISIITSLDLPYRNLIDETNPFDLRVFPIYNGLNNTKDWITEMKKLDSVEDCFIIHRHYLNELLTVNDKKLDGFFSLVKFDPDLHHRVRVIEGDFTSPKENECYISSLMAEKYDVKMGDTVQITRGDNKFEYKVKAIFCDGYCVNQAFQLEIYVKEMPEALEDKPFYVIEAKKGYEGKDVTKEYLSNNEGMPDAAFSTVQEVISNASLTEKIMGAMLLVLSIIIFLVCSVMIRYMLRNLLLKDKRSIAVYKAIGYNNQKLKKMYLGYYLVLSGTSTIFGALCSPLIANIFIRSTFKSLGKSATAQTFFPAVGSILVMNLIVVFQVLRELKSVKEMKPVEILSGTETPLKRKKRKKAHFQKASFSSFGMALRMLQRDRKNTAMVIVTCMISVYTINIALACIGNIDTMKQNNYYWLGFDKADACATSRGDEQRFDELCEKIENDSRVEKVVRCNLDSGMIGINGLGDGCSVITYDSFEEINIPVVEGRNPKHENEIVIGTLLARKLDKKVGDYLTVYLNKDTKISMLIVGTYQSFYNLGIGAKMLKQTFSDYGMNLPNIDASIYFKKDVDKEKVVKEYKKKYRAEAEIIMREERFGNVIEMICKPQRAALLPFAVLVGIIGALNVIYVIYLKNASSKKTYSIYKSIGYCSGHLLKMNICYISIIAIASMVIAIPLLVFLFPKTMVLTMSMFGFEEYPITYNLKLMIFGNVSTFAVFFLSSMLSSKNLYENHITELIQD